MPYSDSSNDAPFANEQISEKQEPLNKKQALISVSDKTGIDKFAKKLIALGFEILSSGGTAAMLNKHSIPVTQISNYTDFPEILGGRVKTLHPYIYASILHRGETDSHVLNQYNIAPISLVVINLYDFDNNQCIEQIDIGGPTLVRAAAKNYKFVTVVVDQQDYQPILQQLSESEDTNTSITTRHQLAYKAFQHTAKYDAIISNFFLTDPESPNGNVTPLRYGENPHQKAILYKTFPDNKASVAHAKQLQGKALSYNNLLDADTALEIIKQFTQPVCSIVKHANPCGVAIDKDLATAYLKAYQSDPTSAFGSIIAVNKPIDQTTANTIINKQFLEILIAPEFTPEAINILSNKPNLRLLQYNDTNTNNTYNSQKIASITNGILLQDSDNTTVNINDLQNVTKIKPDVSTLESLIFAWKVAKFTKSNAIVFAKDQQTIGIGAGQMSRVFSVEIGLQKAQHAGFSTQGCVMASDAFFPFADNIEIAANAGITAIIQPGGSKKDQEVIQAADHYKIAMVFTGIRHFRH
jgi:phosphoribosylaminoimidazolecarboxamide formyltransferase / IMP cyclohydrolase